MRVWSFATVVAITLLIVGCAGHDPEKCYQSVCTEFPKAEIFPIIGNKYRFIVRDSQGDVYSVACLDQFGPKVTSKQKVFTCK